MSLLNCEFDIRQFLNKPDWEIAFGFGKGFY